MNDNTYNYNQNSNEIELIALSNSELKGFAFMIMRGAPMGVLLMHITKARLEKFEKVGLIYRDLSKSVPYFFINQRFINEIMCSFFDTFYYSGFRRDKKKKS